MLFFRDLELVLGLYSYFKMYTYFVCFVCFKRVFIQLRGTYHVLASCKLLHVSIFSCRIGINNVPLTNQVNFFFILFTRTNLCNALVIQENSYAIANMNLETMDTVQRIIHGQTTATTATNT